MIRCGWIKHSKAGYLSGKTLAEYLNRLLLAEESGDRSVQAQVQTKGEIAHLQRSG